ncbi:YgaP family membrane protein [Pontibacter sp. H249]|uniref:YgaP family membrane protein n=1 Tax=Pontibacter sp. H249 TaxID=3133420 RepID=UPI0030C62FAC
MECNVGLVEQKARAIAGLTMVGIGAYYNSKPLALLGLISIATAMIRWCPINSLIGYNGCREEKSISKMKKTA